ncbi:MAG: enoyl-CoA hydratase/isomerase family protein [Candidatus Syntrophopropionicum ammoniitolerans]
MSFKDILFHKDGSLATITLNRPASFNALDLNISKEICTALETCRSDREIRVVILTGSGKVFCSGGDVKYFAQFAHTDPGEPVRQVLDRYSALSCRSGIYPSLFWR